MNDLPPKQLSMIITAEAARSMPAATIPPRLQPPSIPPRRRRFLGSPDKRPATTAPDWDRARFDEYMTGPERVPGSRVAERDGVIAAATFASVQPHMDNTGRVDFVTGLPQYRGLGLGRLVCTAVVRYLVGRGYSASSSSPTTGACPPSASTSPWASGPR